MASSSAADLNILFLPFLSPGHMIPMLDLAILLSNRGAHSIFVTTSSNAKLLRPSLSESDITNLDLVTIPLISESSAMLPENVTALPTPDITPEFFNSLYLLEPHVEHIVLTHRPDCIISDVYYPWTVNLAKRHGITHVAFHGSSYFSMIVMIAISKLRPYESVSSAEELFIVPSLPHPIKLSRSQLPKFLLSPMKHQEKISVSLTETYGTVMNTFYDLEPSYAESYKLGIGRSWNVGPVFLINRSADSVRNRGGPTTSQVFDWLDGKEAGSVLYVCFGSLPRFTEEQFQEIKAGLEALGRPSVWVVRDDPALVGRVVAGEGSNGFVIKGWAPQLAILMDKAVGGFLTHCGWNSCLEGIVAGVPMITWPLFAEQHFNEKLLVDVLGVAVGVGSMVSSTEEEERTLVKAENIVEAVEKVMGGGQEAEKRRKKAMEMKIAAKKAVENRGSSEVELGRLVEELLSLKMAKMKEKTKNGEIEPVV